MTTPCSQNPWSVSVVIPAYNADLYIAGAIESVLAQTLPADEIIVVDDGSTDRTAEQVKKFEGKFHYIYQPNTGGSAARNRGIEHSTSRWIAFLDADDQWLPEKLSLQVALLQKNPHLVWSYANYIVRIVGGENQKPSHPPTEINKLAAGRDYFKNYLHAYAHGIPAHTDTLLVKRSALLEAGAFLHGQKWAQDADLALRLGYKWPEVGYCPQPLAVNNFLAPGGITVRHRNIVNLRCEFIARHLKLSEQNGRLEDFKPCAQRLLKMWVRMLLNNDPAVDLSAITEQFAPLLPANLRTEIRLRKNLGTPAAKMFDLYFNIKNRLLGKPQ